MSDARAIEAVTQTLVSLVDVGVKQVEASAVAVARPIDRVTDTAFAMQTNVLLYQAAMDPQLRNQPPLTVLPGETGQPALPLSLHYLITPYVEDGDDIAAHRMLGGALQVLHEHPALTRAELASIAPYSNVADDIDQITICWQPLEEKDIYSLWSAFQSPYRLSASFEVRVITIDDRRRSSAPMPVLRRGPDDRGPTALVAFPTLTAAQPPNGQPAAFVGETVTLAGTHLTGANLTVRLSHAALDDPIDVPISAPSFTMPDGPAGVWSVALLATDPDGSPMVSNEVPLSVAPTLHNVPLTVARLGTSVTLDLHCAPQVRPGQRIAVLLGARAVPVVPVAAASGEVHLTVTDIDPATYPVRLRVDGVDSPLIDRSTTPASFDATQIVTVTA